MIVSIFFALCICVRVYNSMCFDLLAHLEGSWAKAKEEILADTEVSVDQQKYLASQVLC